MVVLIGNDPTSPAGGKILRNDLIAMKSSFINEVDVKPYNGRTRVLKKFACFIGRNEVRDLLEQSPSDAMFLKLNFAVHGNLIETCGENITDAMTVVIETMNEDKIPYDQVGNLIVIPGFGSHGANGESPCCPSSNP